MMLVRFVTLAFLAALAACACPDPIRGTPFALGVVTEIESSVLGETRTLNVRLPASYGGSRVDRYPVIVLLDGGANEDFPHAAGLVQFLTMMQLMPESIVIGVGNVDRQRDFLYPSTVAAEQEWFPNHGRSDRFRRFLTDELLPFVEERYRCADHRLLIGQSAAGVFATEQLLLEPETFDAYFIVSPALYWNEESLVATAPERLREMSASPWVYLALGDEGDVMQHGFDRLIEALGAHGPAGPDWRDVRFPEETHGTILHRALYRGFELLYGEDWPGL